MSLYAVLFLTELHPQQSSAMLQTADTNIMLLLLSGKSITRYDNSRMAYGVA